MLNTIKFSHNYGKLDGCNFSRSRLLAVQEVNLKDLPKDFIDYDTSYRIGFSHLNYGLKNGKYLLLIFWSGKLFTTLRPAYPSRKVEYYKSKIGEEFEIKIMSK